MNGLYYIGLDVHKKHVSYGIKKSGTKKSGTGDDFLINVYRGSQTPITRSKYRGARESQKVVACPRLSPDFPTIILGDCPLWFPCTSETVPLPRPQVC
jgi:hypothetical protein